MEGRKGKRINEPVVDENYPFLDKSLGFRFWSALLYLGIFVLVFTLPPIRFGLRIEGRKILKKHRKLLRNGAMTVSNHTLRWDLLMVLQAVRFRRLYFPAWKENLADPDRDLIRPFKKGMFTAAYNYRLPVIPLAFSYREPWGLYRLFKKGYPLITLRIGEPVLPDLSLSRREAVSLLRAQVHRRIVELAGLTTNPFPCEGD
jgi:1-acyl-sn-glycerol-3-phosphate acyltransferase